MLSACFNIDEDIIKEDRNEVPQVGTKYFIHQFLECGRSICEAKWHDQKFIVPIMCAESCFRDIILMNSNLVIPRMKIQLGEKISTMKLINNRSWKLILDFDVIKCSKFNAEAPCPYLFWTIRSSEEKELVLGRIIPCFSKSQMSISIFVFH